MATAEPGPSTSCYGILKEKHAERLKKLRDLHLKRNEARQLNHAEVVEEDKRNKLPSNHEARRKRAEWILEDEQKRKEAEEQGKDYNRAKLLDVGADEAERKEKKKRKKNPDPGFSDYEQATFRQYSRQINQIKPDMDNYKRQKNKMGDSFYADTSTIVQGAVQDTPESIDRMVNDLEKQIGRREKYSRRRRHDPDEDIDYINERNMKFNKKLERFYGQYTTEIKQNLERGTAV